jgi:arylsulfatase A
MDRPNIAMLFVDDLGYGDLGFTGHPTTSTPNLDYLAYNGKVLTSWYSGAPVCTASRTALLTGRQPPRVISATLSFTYHICKYLSTVTLQTETCSRGHSHDIIQVGMPGVINSLSAAGLPLNETTIADYLKTAGYATMAIG